MKMDNRSYRAGTAFIVMAMICITILLSVSLAGTFPVHSIGMVAADDNSFSTKMEAEITCSYQANPAFEARVLELINIERAKVGAPALHSQSQLAMAARLHSADMACNNFFSHTGSDGASLSTRVARQGYIGYYYLAENIAAGYSTPESVMNGWMNSSGHRANILNANYTEIGVGYVYWSNSTYGAYWTADFAKPSTLAISGNAGAAGTILNYTGGFTSADGSGNYFITVLMDGPGRSHLLTPVTPLAQAAALTAMSPLIKPARITQRP
jgi:uncharacterized protein YkwD